MNPNQKHRFQYNLALLSAGSATVSVQQLVGSTYQTLATANANSASGSYTFVFTPTSSNIRILVTSNTRFALNNLYLDRDHVDTLVETYALYAGGYRYGYQGSEKDDEAKGKGNSYTTYFRQLDPRLGRWLSIYLKASKFPFESPYVAFHNNPILYNDPRGDDPPEDLIKIFIDVFKKAWGDSFQGEERKSGEVGGVLIRIKTSTEVDGEIVETYVYQVHNYKVTSEAFINLTYNGIPKNAEIVGNFHTHPYDENESKRIRRMNPNFSPSAVPFSFQDLVSYATDIWKGKIGNGDVNFVITETVIYGLTIDDAKLARVFFARINENLMNAEADLMNGTTKLKEGETFNDRQYQLLLEFQQGYENETGRKSGVTFTRTEIKQDGDES